MGFFLPRFRAPKYSGELPNSRPFEKAASESMRARSSDRAPGTLGQRAGLRFPSYRHGDRQTARECQQNRQHPGLICVVPALACVTRLDIRADLEGGRFSSRKGMAKQPVLVVKRVSTDFANCNDKESSIVLPT